VQLLTPEEALAGVRPPTMTKEQWHLMFLASLDAEYEAVRRSYRAWMYR
jgi:hypothetical protein